MYLSETNQARFRIVQVTLPKASAHELEIVPLLIDQRSQLPVRLANRWIVRARRLAVSEKSLRDDLKAASVLYSFCDVKLDISVDEWFALGARLAPRDLDMLVTYLREGDGSPEAVRSLRVAGGLAAKIKHFLRWLAKPLDRGGRTFVAESTLKLYHETLDENFKDLIRFQSQSNRIEPLDADDDVALEDLTGPRKKPNNRFEHPYRFDDDSPWKPQTRLRNWIGYSLGRELGMRRGEIGKVRIDDINLVGSDPVIAVCRRPHDPADTRRSGNRPRVKSIERELPLPSVVATAIRQYMHTPLAKGGRRGARTPYLLVTAQGLPMSGSSLDAIWAPVNGRAPFHMSWHVLRHTWAEELAEDLFEKHKGLPDADLLSVQVLRELGGWTVNSSMPFHYIQRAVKRRADDYLRQRHRRRFDED